MKSSYGVGALMHEPFLIGVHMHKAPSGLGQGEVV